MKLARNNKPNIYRWNFFGLGKQNLIGHLIRTRVALLEIKGFQRSFHRRKDENSTRKACTE